MYCRFVRRKTALYEDSEPLTEEFSSSQLYSLGMVFHAPKLSEGGEILAFNGKRYMLPANETDIIETDITNSIELCYGVIAEGEFDEELAVTSPLPLGELLDRSIELASEQAAVIFIEGRCQNINGNYLTIEDTDFNPFPYVGLNFADYEREGEHNVSAVGIICMGQNEMVSPFVAKNEKVNDSIDYHIHLLVDDPDTKKRIVHLQDMTFISGTVKIADISEVSLTEF